MFRGKSQFVPGDPIFSSNSLLDINIVSGTPITLVVIVAAVFFVYLLIRPPTRRWLLAASIALIGGVILTALIGVGLWWSNLLDIPIRPVMYATLAIALAGICLAVVNLWKSRWWRKVIAVIAIPSMLIAGAFGINAEFGLNQTLGSLLGVVSQHPIALPRPTPSPMPVTPTASSSGPPTPSPTPTLKAGPLWQTWTPPASMPKTGEVGTQVIPNTLSGFTSRPAGIYLPPAALVPNPPSLPLLIMMMGQPGSPDTIYNSQILDAFAARNKGLAPIVIVADQIGNPYQDPMCLDTAQYGNAKTFITKDVVNWALAKLNIIHDPAYWTIAGYSNGGACAVSFAAEFPNIWSNVFDISGEEYPGSEHSRTVLSKIFRGDQAAYDAIKPENLLAAKKLPRTFGVFTVGSNDPRYIPGVQRMAAAASAAGMVAVYYEVPNGGHVLPALTDGLTKGYELLFPRLGLSRGPSGMMCNGRCY